MLQQRGFPIICYFVLSVIFISCSFLLSISHWYWSPFAEDGDLVGFDGTHLKGRQRIASFHQQLFDAFLKGSRLVRKIRDMRFLAKDVAIIIKYRASEKGRQILREILEPYEEFFPRSDTDR